MEEFKQVIAVRVDLRMGKGKLAAQVAHASVACVIKCQSRGGEWELWLNKWLDQGQKKVVVKVRGEDDLYQLYTQAANQGLPSCLIRDAGLTQLEPGTPTAVAIGPAPSDRVDRITGDLPLL